jgi:hypothetical protein
MVPQSLLDRLNEETEKVGWSDKQLLWAFAVYLVEKKFAHEFLSKVRDQVLVLQGKK